MDDRKFFRVLWRINAVVIFCASILLIGKLVYDEFFQTPYYPPPGANAITLQVNEKGDVVSREQWTYVGLKYIAESSTFLIGLQPVIPSDPVPPDRNLLFLNSDLQSGKWLFSDNQQDIINYRGLQFGDKKNTLAVFYEVIERPSQNEQVTPSSKRSFYLSRPDGSDLTKVLTDYARLMDQVLTDENHLVVLYILDGRVHSALITLSDFKLIKDVELPPIIQ